MIQANATNVVVRLDRINSHSELPAEDMLFFELPLTAPSGALPATLPSVTLTVVK